MRAGSVPGAIGILLVLTTTVLYLAIIDSQGDTGSRRTIGVVIPMEPGSLVEQSLAPQASARAVRA